MSESITRKRRLDIILIFSLLFVSVIAVALVLLLRTEGETVTVEVDGVRTATYSLSENGEYDIGGTNTIVIEDGYVYMKNASCPTHSCIKTGKIRYAGESIICLPNKVVVTIVGEGGVDLVS